MTDTTLMMVTYDRLDLTKRTIEGLLKESAYFNLVIVDNGSTDGTVDWLKFNLVGNRFHKVFLSENKGIAIGRNIALAKADEIKTSWYCTVDNDVEMPTGWLDECIQILEMNKGYGAIGVNMEDKLYPLVTKNGHTFQNKPAGNLGTACMVFRKQVHQMLGFFNTEYGAYGEEDADFGHRIRVAGFKMGYIERMGVHLGSDEEDVNEYRKFKTKQHADNLAKFRQNCALYSQRKKPLHINFVNTFA